VASLGGFISALSRVRSMSYVATMPKFGLEMQEGELVAWYVSEGDPVEPGDVIAEVESEKTIGEIEAKEAGVLREILLQETEVAAPGTPVAIIAENGVDIDDLQTEASRASESDKESAGSVHNLGERNTESQQATQDTNETQESVIATPEARRLANERGLDLSVVTGTGPSGAVTESDVEAYEPSQNQPSEGATQTVRDERELGPMRRTIADRLSESYRDAVHVTASRDIDPSELQEAAVVCSDAVNQPISLTDVLLTAVTGTLEEHPEFNATFENETHRLIREHNIAIAVDMEAGLTTPVLPDVAPMPIEELATTRHEMTERVQAGDHTMSDLSGGTFTVSNLGPLGVDSFTPIINPPQVAILGVGRIRTRDDTNPDDPRLTVDLSFDHRIVDGADAGRFLSTLTEYCENPWRLLDVSRNDET